MKSIWKYKPEDFEYLKKYFDESFLMSDADVLLALDDKIIEVGFDDNMEFYNDEGKKLQKIYDNIYDMNQEGANAWLKMIISELYFVF